MHMLKKERKTKGFKGDTPQNDVKMSLQVNSTSLLPKLILSGGFTLAFALLLSIIRIP